MLLYLLITVMDYSSENNLILYNKTELRFNLYKIKKN